LELINIVSVFSGELLIFKEFIFDIYYLGNFIWLDVLESYELLLLMISIKEGWRSCSLFILVFLFFLFDEMVDSEPAEYEVLYSLLNLLNNLFYVSWSNSYYV
jgi:hypothetical protein